jgi:predicted ester cyclase
VLNCDSLPMMPPATDLPRTGEHLERIRQYYACFNERRFDAAAAMFIDDAVIEQAPFQCRERGGAAYRLFAGLWTGAFPDAVVSITDVIDRPGGAVEVHVLTRGTHAGDLAMGGCVFKPTGVKLALRVRELLEFRGARIASSFVSFDLQELAHQLARVDDTQLLMHLSRLRYMEDQLRNAALDSVRRLALLDSIGRELDAARQVVRPYFAR